MPLRPTAQPCRNPSPLRRRHCIVPATPTATPQCRPPPPGSSRRSGTTRRKACRPPLLLRGRTRYGGQAREGGGPANVHRMCTQCAPTPRFICPIPRDHIAFPSQVKHCKAILYKVLRHWTPPDNPRPPTSECVSGAGQCAPSAQCRPPPRIPAPSPRDPPPRPLPRLSRARRSPPPGHGPRSLPSARGSCGCYSARKSGQSVSTGVRPGRAGGEPAPAVRPVDDIGSLLKGT
jgi:hypothetical protein